MLISHVRLSSPHTPSHPLFPDQGLPALTADLRGSVCYCLLCTQVRRMMGTANILPKSPWALNRGLFCCQGALEILISECHFPERQERRNLSMGPQAFTSHSFCGRLCPVSHSPTSFPSPGPMWLLNDSKTVLKGYSVCSCRHTRPHANHKSDSSTASPGVSHKY